MAYAYIYTYNDSTYVYSSAKKVINAFMGTTWMVKLNDTFHFITKENIQKIIKKLQKESFIILDNGEEMFWIDKIIVR